MTFTEEEAKKLVEAINNINIPIKNTTTTTTTTDTTINDTTDIINTNTNTISTTDTLIDNTKTKKYIPFDTIENLDDIKFETPINIKKLKDKDISNNNNNSNSDEEKYEDNDDKQDTKMKEEKEEEDCNNDNDKKEDEQDKKYISMIKLSNNTKKILILGFKINKFKSKESKEYKEFQKIQENNYNNINKQILLKLQFPNNKIEIENYFKNLIGYKVLFNIELNLNKIGNKNFKIIWKIKTIKEICLKNWLFKLYDPKIGNLKCIWKTGKLININNKKIIGKILYIEIISFSKLFNIPLLKN